MHKTIILGMAAVVSFLISHTAAFAVNLPATANFTVAAGANSTYDITLLNVGAGFDVTNGTYAGWILTADPNPPNPNQTYPGLLSASADWVPWDQISFILNNKSGSVQDVQAAIAYLALGTPIDANAQPIAAQLVSDAQQYGAGYVPGPTDITPILLEWGAPSEAATIIELPPALVEGADRFTAGGWITRNGSKCNFGIQGGMLNGHFWGGITYNDQAAGLKMRGRSCTSYYVIDTNCRRATYDVTINGVAGTATVTVCDNGEPGRNDVVQISLSNGYTAAGDLGASGKGTGSGNVQLHKPKKAKK